MTKTKIEVHLPLNSIKIGSIDRSTVSDELIDYLNGENAMVFKHEADEEESLYSVEYLYMDAVRLIEEGWDINQDVLDELKQLEDICVEYDFAYVRFITL